MSAITTGYKVVMRREGGLYSVSILGVSRVEYKVGEWVEAPYNPSLNIVLGLFYFKNIYNVEHYSLAMEIHPDLELWECEVRDGKPIVDSEACYIEKIISAGFKKIELTSNQMRSIHAYPEGACTAQAIKLIRRIK